MEYPRFPAFLGLTIGFRQRDRGALNAEATLMKNLCHMIGMIRHRKTFQDDKRGTLRVPQFVGKPVGGCAGVDDFFELAQLFFTVISLWALVVR